MAKKIEPSEQERKPDASYIERDGGFEFTAWGIHVAANSLDDAKQHIMDYHGIDVDKDNVPINGGNNEG